MNRWVAQYLVIVAAILTAELILTVWNRNKGQA